MIVEDVLLLIPVFNVNVGMFLVKFVVCGLIFLVERELIFFVV